MSVESIPNFTRTAAKLWANVPAHAKKLLLTNVWRVQCHHEITIIDFAGTVVGGNLLLSGKCSVCHGDVARVIETG